MEVFFMNTATNINENLLQQMIKLQEQLQLANNKNVTETKKEKKALINSWEMVRQDYTIC